MLKTENKSILSNVINHQDDTPVIVFGPRMENVVDDDVPPFYVTLKIHDLLLHNTMFDSGASHNLMPKEVMDNLGLDMLYPKYTQKTMCGLATFNTREVDHF